MPVGKDGKYYMNPAYMRHMESIMEKAKDKKPGEDKAEEPAGKPEASHKIVVEKDEKGGYKTTTHMKDGKKEDKHADLDSVKQHIDGHMDQGAAQDALGADGDNDQDSDSDYAY